MSFTSDNKVASFSGYRSGPLIFPPALPHAGSRRQRSRKAVAEIKEISLDLFLKHGFDATTVNDLVTRIGVSRRTFFRYFASKEDVVFSWVDEEAEAAWPMMIDRAADEHSLVPMKRAFLKLASRQAHDLANTYRVMTLIFRTPSLRGRLHNELARWLDKLNDTLHKSGAFDQDSFFRVRVQNASSVAAYMTAVQTWVTSNAEVTLMSLVSAAFDALTESASADVAVPTTGKIARN